MIDKHLLSPRYQHLEAGKNYRIAAPFIDFDRQHYEYGQTLTFEGSHFSPYDDGLSLFFSKDSLTLHIRLQQRPEEQQAIIEQLPMYFEIVESIADK